ncbi:MAG TPA: cadherin repeat domain-containing protein [Marinagarivorans sp.]
MYKTIIALGLCLLGVAGCFGRGYTWLSSSEVEFYENYREAAYLAILDGPDVENTLYSITGQDAAQFAINVQSGEVHFQRSPDYEDPQDFNGDNRYEITVIATDATTGKQHSTVDVGITVKDAESVKATKLFPLPNSYVEPNGDGIVPMIITIDDLYAPVFYPDNWQAVDTNITRFFNYPQPFF